MSKRILIIDDDPVLSRMMREALAAYDITVAATAEEGLSLYEQRPFDLVICDLVLPGMGGLELIEEIRVKHPHARLIVASAQGSGDNLLASLRQNVVDFLVKPFSTEELAAAVSNLLEAESAIEVVSATASWVALRIPGSFRVGERLEAFFTNLKGGIDEAMQPNISIAFRELMNNAIEHGAHGDSKRYVTISYVRFDRAIMYRIEDPGSGFDFGDIPHAAVSNPGDPMKHVEVRIEKGMRAGGFGLLWIQNLADQVVFNERRNQVIFIKYLDAEKK